MKFLSRKLFVIEIVINEFSSSGCNIIWSFLFSKINFPTENCTFFSWELQILFSFWEFRKFCEFSNSLLAAVLMKKWKICWFQLQALKKVNKRNFLRNCRSTSSIDISFVQTFCSKYFEHFLLCKQIKLNHQPSTLQRVCLSMEQYKPSQNYFALTSTPAKKRKTTPLVNKNWRKVWTRDSFTCIESHETVENISF